MIKIQGYFISGMKNNKQIFLILVVGIFIVPQITLAAWWNPLNWSIWNIFRLAPHIQQTEIVNNPSASSTTPEKINTKTTNDNSSTVQSNKKTDNFVEKTSKPKIAEQAKTEAPKTTIVTLPSGAIVEINIGGEIVRTIKEAPQQEYVQPQITKTMSADHVVQPTVEPTSRILEVMLQDKSVETHSKNGEEVVRVPLFFFTLKASGNADTHISKIKIRTMGPTRFVGLWIESDDGSYVSNKINGTTDFIGGYAHIPVSITIRPGVLKNFSIYVNTPTRISNQNGYPSGIEQIYIEGITSDAGSISDFPLISNVALWYDR